MSKTQEALSVYDTLKMALEFLEEGNFVYPTSLATTIKEALAEQPAQQPHCDDCGGFDPECPLAQPAQQEQSGPINEGWQITVAHGHSGYGVYAHMEDYPEEGAVLVQAIEQPAQQQKPVLWQILNGVRHADVRSTENLAKEAAAGMQKAHDLGGSLAAFHVRPLYTSPPQPAHKQENRND